MKSLDKGNIKVLGKRPGIYNSGDFISKIGYMPQELALGNIRFALHLLSHTFKVLFPVVIFFSQFQYKSLQLRK